MEDSNVLHIFNMTFEEGHQLLLQKIAEGPNAVNAFFDAVVKDNANPVMALEFAFQVLERATEETQYTAIARAGQLLEQLGKGEHVEKLEALHKKLPALKGIRDYRTDFDFYIRLLKGRRDGICDCKSYSSYNNSPTNPLFNQLNSYGMENGVYGYFTEVECRNCGQKYKIETDCSYHYNVHRWMEM